eukprot:2241147-Pleurochrysis_carterae.AAC.3
MQSRLCVPFQRMMMMVIVSTDAEADFCWIPFTLLMALHELVGVAIASAAEAATAAEGEASTAAKERVAQSVRSLLLHVAQQDLGDEERRIADGMLCASGNPKALKGGLLKALKLSETHRGFLGLPALMEETRKLLAAAPAKGVSSYLEVREETSTAEPLLGLLRRNDTAKCSVWGIESRLKSIYSVWLRNVPWTTFAVWTFTTPVMMASCADTPKPGVLVRDL